MKYEIERKFLVNKDLWYKIEKPKGDLFRQGYISTEPNKTIRVRMTDESAFLTFKGLTVGSKRLEYEYEIPIKDAKEILDEFTDAGISKIRYKINHNGKVWEVDEFLDDNLGLVVAELELRSEDEKFDLPGWIDKEVTEDVRYFNSNLSLNPFKNW